MDDEAETGLPASIEMAWGLRSRPTKGPKRGLSLERIVDAAIQIARSDGLAAVSMGRVAADLGASTMSLYRYVGAKDELLALMLDAIGPPPAAVPEAGWRAGLSNWAWQVLALWRGHPWGLRIALGTPPATPNQLAWLDSGLETLRATGLAEGEKMSVMMMLAGYVRNQAMMATDLADAARAQGITAQAAMAAYISLLTRLIDARRFPALSAVIEASVLNADEDEDPDAEFVFGLERLLDGVDVLVRARDPEHTGASAPGG